MANPDLILIPFAQDGDKNTIPLELGIGDPVYRASLKAGFPPDTRIPKDIGGEPPDGLDFNGILNVLSQAIVFMQKGNAYQFDASLAPYPIGALVRSNDNLTTFQSTIALNSNNPNSNMSGWRVYNGSGFIVDNLTTNDSARALSAAQGKVLQDNKLGKTENAVSATKLQTERTINNVLFDGTADINLPLIGYGQTWQDVTSSRSSGSTYTNNTGKPITVIVSIRDANVFSGVLVTVAGVVIIDVDDVGAQGTTPYTFIVPNGSTYSVTVNSNTIRHWSELR